MRPKINTRNGEIRATCPFRDRHEGEADGKASLRITSDRQHYNCFSCKKRGSLLTLLTTKLKVPFEEAMEMAVIEIKEDSMPKYEELTEDIETPTFREYDGEVVNFSRSPLMFLKRGFTKQTLQHFKVGSVYDVERAEEIAQMPIFVNGTMVAVMQRRPSLLGGGKRLSLNPTGFPIHSIIYHPPTSDEILLAEGFTSCWRIFQNGTKSVGAAMGSEITLQQATILSRYKLVVACFDNDIAGMRGAEQLNILLRSQTEVRFLVLPSSYNDPDNIQDAGTWQSLVRTNIVDYAEYSQERVRDYGDAYRKIRDEVIDSFDVPF